MTLTDETVLPSVQDLKTQAKRLRTTMAERGTPITHAMALEAIARQWGFRDWNTAIAAAQSAPPSLMFNVGARVTGHYLGHPFEGHLKAVRHAQAGFTYVTVIFDEAVDVVTSEHFSAFRKQVNACITAQGTTTQKTSDGTPHMVLRRA